MAVSSPNPTGFDHYRLLFSIFCTSSILDEHYSVQAQGRSLNALKYGKGLGNVQISIGARKSMFSSAEPLFVNLAIRNSGKSPVSLVETSPETDFEFVVRNDEGDIMPLTRYGKSQHSSDRFGVVVASLKPNEIQKYRFLLNRLYDITQDGVYTISAHRRILKAGRISQAQVTSNSLKITIESPPEKPMRENIKTFNPPA